MLPALHGGVTAAFLEVTAIIELSLVHPVGRYGGGPRSTLRRRPRCRPCPRPSTSPWITCAPACRAMPMPGPRSTARAGAMPRPCRGLAGQPRPPLRAGLGAFPDAAPPDRPRSPPHAPPSPMPGVSVASPLPIVLSNATIPLLGRGRYRRHRPAGPGGADRCRRPWRGDPGHALLGLRLSAHGHLGPCRPGPRRGRQRRTQPPSCCAPWLIGGAAGPGLVVLQAPLIAAAFAVAPASAEVEGLARTYLAIRIWGAPATHRALCPHRLADRAGTHARRPDPAAVAERAEHRAGPVVRAGPWLGRAAGSPRPR